MLASALTILISAAAFLVVLTVIVFVHEMGHYLVARWNGIAIQTFSIGFGRELVGFTDKLGTRWRVSAIPLGGYVRFVGDMNATSALPDHELIANASPALQKRLFVNKSVWRRIAVVVAGPLANIIFTFVILYALLVGFGRYTLEPVIDGVVAGSVAQEAGLEAGDRFVRIDSFDVRGFEDVQRLVSTAPERPITVIVDRNGDLLTFVLTPAAGTTTDRFGNVHRVGVIGIERTDITEEDITVYRPGPVEAVSMTFEEIRFIIDRTAAFLGDFFVGRGDVDQLGGPIKVAQVSGQVATLGIVPLINLMALLSLNIGIFNLFPIPMLDGGHLLYYIVEAIRGRPLSQKAQEIGFRFGLAIVFTLTVFTFINDIF